MLSINLKLVLRSSPLLCLKRLKQSYVLMWSWLLCAAANDAAAVIAAT